MSKIKGPIIIKEKTYETFEAACLQHGLPRPEPELYFHPERKWRFDFGWRYQLIALEIEGGAFTGHGHRSVGKYLGDMEKYNEAAILGWRVIRCTTKDIKTGNVLLLLKRVLYASGEQESNAVTDDNVMVEPRRAVEGLPPMCSRLPT